MADDPVVLALARSLGADGLSPFGDLAVAVETTDPRALSPLGADILFAFWVRDVPPPPGVVARVRAAVAIAAGDDLATRANRAATAALLARLDAGVNPPTAPRIEPPGELSWEDLAAWAAGASALAIPGLDGNLLAGRELDLLRGVGFALYRNHPAIAGRLLRWLALRVSPSDPAFSCALHDALAMARRAGAVIPAAAALAIVRRWPSSGAAPAPRFADADAGDPPTADARHKLVDRALGWVERNLARFALPAGIRDLAGLYHLKAIGELAIVAEHCVAAGEPWVHAGRRLARFAVAQVGDGDRLAALIEANPELIAFATVVPALHRAGGMRGPRLRSALLRHAPGARPELAYLVGCSLHEIGLAPPCDLEQAWGWSDVAAERAPWRLSPTQLYLVTHGAWYRARQGWPDPRGRAYLARWLPVWLRHFEIAGHYDFLSEMIITWHELHRTHAPSHAWDVLFAAQREDGAVPVVRPGAAVGDGVLDDEYHTTLTCIWAATMSR